MRGRNFKINVLRQSQRVIGRQTFFLRKYIGRIENESGYWVSDFGQPIKLKGSVQPVSTTQYKSLMLDFSKYYIKIYCLELINLIDRDNNADEIIFKDCKYHVIPNQRWHEISGWNSVLAIRVGMSDA